MVLARKMAWSALGSSAVLLVAAFVCLITGPKVQDSTGTLVNSHASGTWVLGALAVVFFVHAIALFSWASEELYGPANPGMRDARD